MLLTQSNRFGASLKEGYHSPFDAKFQVAVNETFIENCGAKRSVQGLKARDHLEYLWQKDACWCQSRKYV